jgi:hypothetical protein
MGAKRLGLTLARKLRQQHDEIDRIEGPKGEAKHRAEILQWIKQNPEWRSETAELTRVRPGLKTRRRLRASLEGGSEHPRPSKPKRPSWGKYEALVVGSQPCAT